ncbi:hypothetical protein FIBSPDRAFT_1051820 [Athelia psychrophila]|uniref:Uncharacterized protein n=1 Tax=Athelia psychrophila TaxID=1759441 RepID=A0A165YEQ9_9AGAM|nr:hypothetical protein FIBSPDRAFT_1051820 [Fibularhizoctonia sp. CBS 109695]
MAAFEVDPTLKSEEVRDRAAVIFNTEHVSGGTTSNVNGDYIVNNGDEIHAGHIQINHFYHIIESDKIRNFNANAERVADPTHGLAQPPNFHPSGPLVDHVVAGVAVNTFYTSSSADHSLIEIQIIADMMDVLMENPSLCNSAKLPETLASLQ